MSYASEVLTDAPKAWYRMAEASGLIQDSSGNVMNATASVSTPTYHQVSPITSDASAFAIGFSAQNFQVPDNNIIDVADTFTVEVWYKRTAFGQVTGETIFDRGSGAFKFFIEGSQTPGQTDKVVLTKPGTGNILVSSVLINNTNWHHIVVTKSGATVRLYIDSVQDAGAVVTNQTTTSTATPLFVGSSRNTDDFAKGLVAEAALYATALSSTRVSAHFTAATSGATVPTAPQTLQATAGNAQVALSWTAPSSNGGSAITGYKIYRGLTTNSETLLATPAGTGTAYTDLTTANGTTYFYKVSAVNAVGESVLSNEVSATPVAAPTAPTAPQTLTATGGDSQISLTWALPSSDGGSALTGYKLYRSLSSGAEVLFAGPLGTNPAYTDATTANGTIYYYKVTAINAVGESALSNEAAAIPAAPAAPIAVRTFKRFYGPSLLSNAAALLYTCPSNTQAVVRHIHVSNPTGSPVDFTLSIGASAAGTRLWDAIPVAADDVLDHYQDFTLAAAEIIQGFAGSASTLNLTIDGYEVAPIVPPTIPSAPLSLGATAGDAQVTLNWSSPASNGGSAITSFKIYRSTTTGAETLLASPTGTALTYIDLTAANGTAYFYKVTAVNAVGEGPLSNEATATPTAAPIFPSNTLFPSNTSP